MLRQNAFYSTLIQTLTERRQADAGNLLETVLKLSSRNMRLSHALHAWSETLDIKSLARLCPGPVPVQSSASLTMIFEQICEAGHVASQRLRETPRLNGSALFPAYMDYLGGWSLSAQGDRAGYQCQPRARLPFIEDYETVEVAIYGPDFTGTRCLKALELPYSTAIKFSVSSEDDVLLGGNMTWNDIALLGDRIEVLKSISHIRLCEISQPVGGYVVSIGAGQHNWAIQTFRGDETDGDNAIAEFLERMEKTGMPGSVSLASADFQFYGQTPDEIVDAIGQAIDDASLDGQEDSAADMFSDRTQLERLYSNARQHSDEALCVLEL